MLAGLMLLALADPSQARPLTSELGRATELELIAQLPRPGEAETEPDPVTGRLRPLPVLAELRARIGRGTTLDLECWRTILIDRGYLRWRRIWPVDEPFAIALHLPALEPSLRVRLVPRVSGWKAASAERGERGGCLGTDDSWQAEDYQILGALDARALGAPDARALDPEKRGALDEQARELSFDLVPDASERSWDRGATALVHSLGPIVIEVRPTRHLDEVLHRRKSSPPGAEIVRALRVEADARQPNNRQVTLLAHAPTWPKWLACSLEITLAGGSPPPPSASLLLRASTVDPSCELTGLWPPDLTERRFTSCWKVHLRGTFEGALRNWDATQYWAGEIEVPLADLIRR